MIRLKNICFLCVLALICAACVDEIEQLRYNDDNVPEGYVRLDIGLVAVDGKAFITRAGEADPLLTRIDDVHMMIFEDTDKDSIIADTDSLIIRNFYEYGIKQNIYLKKGEVYYIYIIANLDDSNCPNGSVNTYFNDVKTYGDLKNKYVQIMERNARDLNKMIMATKEIVPIKLPAGSNVFSPQIPLHRLQSKFSVNIYNKVQSQTDLTITSGVYPTTINAADLPRYSYVHSRPVEENNGGSHDYAFSLTNPSSGFFNSTNRFLSKPEEVVQIGGNWYTRQSVEFFCFENRRGAVSEIDNYTVDTIPDIPHVYGRKKLAPDFSTYLVLNSLTEDNTLLTFVHAGKGRDQEQPTLQDDITNFDVDRSSVYNFNIYINGIDDVRIDTRRSFLDQLVLFTLPDVDHIDAHYMDIPSFVIGSTKGYAKLQSGTGLVDANGEIIMNSDTHEPMGWTPMLDTNVDSARWLRFSWKDPYDPSTRPVNTSLYVGMSNVDGVTSATPILHFNEYINTEKARVPAVNPGKRTAIIKVGFVVGATSADTYDAGVADQKEAAFYIPISQYGLKTIGQVGGYQDGNYNALLGVESVEEYRMQYYIREGFPQDVINNGPFWRYRPQLVNHNQAYDGKQATIDHYEDYRRLFTNNIPPIRWATTSDGVYNPQSNTNAADYCMRKNRDEDGNGIIEGDEVKWYLPTPVQVMQMFTWRDAFRGGAYTLNHDVPFGGSSYSRYYWTTNEFDRDNAYAVDFNVAGTAAVAYTVALAKSGRNPVRCVRDIPGQADPMFSIIENKHMAVDLTDHFPYVDNSKPGLSTDALSDPAKNTLASKFLVSRWYVTENSDHTGDPFYGATKNKGASCDTYEEVGYPVGGWRLPSQQELSFLYAYGGMIEDLLEMEYPGPNTSGTYHTFRQAHHWGITNDGNNAHYWDVDFATGSAQTVHKGKDNGYFRCVYYLQ